MAEYIDREALIERFKTLGLGEHSFMERAFADGVYCILENFPAADVVPVVHGRWVYGEDVDIECSHCGRDALTEGDYRQVRSNFCPHCGAKMDGEPDGRI